MSRTKFPKEEKKTSEPLSHCVLYTPNTELFLTTSSTTAIVIARMVAFDLETCARPNILKLQPYRCARDDYEDNGINILLDANENAYGPGLDMGSAVVNGHNNDLADLNVSGLNRYPDPHQIELKKLICHLRNSEGSSDLQPENLFVGVGSDEAIDSLIRTFCEPGKSSLLICPPTYGMYKVSACINDVGIVNVPLNPDFTPDVSRINDVLSSNSSIKLVYLCSPGNPTAKTIPQSAIEQILAHPTWNGVLVIDEAYIDFATRNQELTSLPKSNSPWDPPSMAPIVPCHPNLVVMGTLSKAHGLAGLRLGFAFCPAPIARLLNALKAPYNISNPTSQLAIKAMSPSSLELAHKKIKQIVVQRNRLVRELPNIPGIGRIVGGTEANFLLYEILDGVSDQSDCNSGDPRVLKSGSKKAGQPSNSYALAVYEQLAGSKGVVVRFRGKEHGCEGCLRVTVGTEEEVTVFLKEIKDVLADLLGPDKHIQDQVRQDAAQDQRQREESNVIA